MICYKNIINCYKRSTSLNLLPSSARSFFLGFLRPTTSSQSFSSARPIRSSGAFNWACSTFYPKPNSGTFLFGSHTYYGLTNLIVLLNLDIYDDKTQHKDEWGFSQAQLWWMNLSFDFLSSFFNSFWVELDTW